MTTLRELVADDLFKFNSVSFESFVERYGIHFYLSNMAKNPELCQVVVAPDDRLVGMLVGKQGVNENEKIKSENGQDLHPTYGHVSFVAVASDYRRLGLGTYLMGHFTAILERYADWYVDLYVRQSNVTAIQLYESLGYVKYRHLPRFYTNENGFEFRMPLSRDVGRKSLEGIAITMPQVLRQIFKELLAYIKGRLSWQHD